MKKICNHYLPALSISFTLTILSSSILNLLNGNDLSGYHAFVLQLFGFITVVMIIDHLFGKINFKTYISYVITSILTYYVLFIITSYVFHWFGFHPRNIIQCSIMFLSINGLIYNYYYNKQKQNATVINDALKKND